MCTCSKRACMQLRKHTIALTSLASSLTCQKCKMSMAFVCVIECHSGSLPPSWLCQWHLYVMCVIGCWPPSWLCQWHLRVMCVIEGPSVSWPPSWLVVFVGVIKINVLWYLSIQADFVKIFVLHNCVPWVCFVITAICEGIYQSPLLSRLEEFAYLKIKNLASNCLHRFLLYTSYQVLI